jgi:DNA-binding NarL/FixJ family response regulator
MRAAAIRNERHAERKLGTVLVADGDRDSCARAGSALQRVGFATIEVGTGAAALEAVRAEPLVLVVLEVSLPDMTGYEVCVEIRRRLEELPVFFLSGIRTEPLDRVAGLLLGADDFIVKPFDPDELVARVRRFVNRRPTARPEAEEEPLWPKLTMRETEVLVLLAAGRRQKEIADELTISQKTVATHIQNLLRKVGVHSRAELVARAYAEGLVVPEAPDELDPPVPALLAPPEPA